MPIGSTEQHGPSGLIGTDAICPEHIAIHIGDKLDVLVAPTLNIGMAQQHMGFAGSITLRPTTLINVIVDILESLAKQGFRHIYFLNGHGGNIATAKTGFSEYYANHSLSRNETSQEPVCAYLRNWWDGARVRTYSRENFGDAEGSHATPSEISLSYHAHPDAVKTVTIDPPVAPRGTFRDAADYRAQFPDGRIGSDPSLASIQHGESILNAAVDDIAEDILNILS